MKIITGKFSQQNTLICIGFFVVLFINGAAQIISSNSAKNNYRHLEQQINQNSSKFSHITTMLDVIRKRMLLLYDIVLVSHDPFEMDEKIIEFSNAVGEYLVARNNLVKLNLTPAQIQQIENQKKILGNAKIIVDAVLEQAYKGNTEGAFKNIHYARLSNEEAIIELQNMRSLQQVISREQLIASTVAYKKAQNQIKILNIFSIILSLLVIWSVVKRIGALDSSLKSALAELRAANSNLEQRVEHKTKELMKTHQENIRLGAELNITKKIQHIVLPSKKEIQSVSYLDIAAYMKAATEVGGDYYDVLPHENGVRIGIGDVTGHGLESGVVMLMTQSAVRALHNCINDDIKKTMMTINKTIYENVIRMECEKNLTLTILDYQPIKNQNNQALGKIRVCGQHEVIIIYRENQKIIEIVDTDELGFPIGLVEDISDFVHDINLELYHGDVLVLFTDGITEAANEDNQLFGLDRLCDVIKNNALKDAEGIKDEIITTVTDHIGNQTIFDDITLVVLKQ